MLLTSARKAANGCGVKGGRSTNLSHQRCNSTRLERTRGFPNAPPPNGGEWERQASAVLQSAMLPTRQECDMTARAHTHTPHKNPKTRSVRLALGNLSGQHCRDLRCAHQTAKQRNKDQATVPRDHAEVGQTCKQAMTRRGTHEDIARER